MGGAWSSPEESQEAAAAPVASQPEKPLAASLVESVRPDRATVNARPAYDELKRLEEIQLQFCLDGETVALVWLPVYPSDTLSAFLVALDAGTDAELGSGKGPRLAAKGQLLKLAAPQLITHLPRALYGRPLAAALCNL